MLEGSRGIVLATRRGVVDDRREAVWVFGGRGRWGVQGAKAPVRDVTALNTDSCIRVLAHTHFHLALSTTSSSRW